MSKQKQFSEEKNIEMNNSKIMLIILNEAVEYANSKDSDLVIDIDVRKVYEHFNNKYFNRFIELNLRLNPYYNREYLRFECDLEFISAMNHFSLYDVQKLELLKIGKEAIERYERYLNK